MAKSLIQDIIIIKKQVVPLTKKNPSSGGKDRRDKDEKKEEKPRGRIFRTLLCFRLPRVPRLEFHHSKRKLKWTLAIVAIFVIALGGFIVLKYFSSVIVEITPRQQFVDVDVVFKASIEPVKDELPLEMMQINHEEKDIFYYFLAGGIGIIIIYISGITQLSLVTGIGIKKALMVGVFPFLPGDILKIIAASFIASKLKLVIPLR